jgi:membrane protein YqaA with SNARE-associated domain
MSDTVGILSLFISSFLAATLLPGGSEAVLFAVLKVYPETLWYALVIASIGNTLGGMVTFGMGWLLPQRRGGSKAAGLRQDHPEGESLAASTLRGHPPAVSIPPSRRLEADCLPLVCPSRVQTQKLKHVEKVRFRHGGAEHSGAGRAVSHPLTQLSDFDRNVLRVRRYGTPALLLAWVPLIGDALCLTAGWLRLNPWQAALFMAIGKFARYGLIAFTMSWPLSM